MARIRSASRRLLQVPKRFWSLSSARGKVIMNPAVGLKTYAVEVRGEDKPPERTMFCGISWPSEQSRRLRLS